jgi:hypothetical protein
MLANGACSRAPCAAALYRHNSSVPTLAELQKPAAEGSARSGSAQNMTWVSVAPTADRTRFGYTLETTHCSDWDSGNSRCGRELGATLSPNEKKALLEYLKTR